MRVQIRSDIDGRAGSAWELDVELDDTDPIDQSASVACWFLTCPGQTPFWEHYVLTTAHLRPVEGQSQEPVIRVPHATHEVMILALDPTSKPVATDPTTWHFLRPINLAEQVQLPSDEAARVLTRKAAEAMVAGLLWAEPPASGQVEPWQTVLIQSSAHLRGEPHGTWQLGDL